MPHKDWIGSWMKRLRGQGVGAVLARGASVFLIVQLFSVAIAFGVNVLLARSLGADSYGTYVWVYSWVMTLLLLCRAGLGTASLRFVAAFVATADWVRLRSYLSSTRIIVLTASLLVSLCTAVVVWSLGERLPPEARLTFFVGCVALPIHAFVQVWGFALRGFKRVLVSQLPGAIVHPLLLGLGVALVVLGAPGRLDAAGTMGLNAASALAALLWTAVALRRATPPEVRTAVAAPEASRWLRAAAPLLFINALNVIMQRADVLLLGSLASPADVGVYSAASRIAGSIAFGLTAVSAWAAPLISDLHARGDRAGLQRLARIAAQGIFAFTLPLTVVLIIFGRELLGWFGPEFTRSYVPLVILVASQLVNALVGPVGFLMTMTGREKAAAGILTVHALVNVGLNVVLIPAHGIVGAAVATGVTRASWNLVMAVAVWRSMRLRATIF